jgi:ribonuclease J
MRACVLGTAAQIGGPRVELESKGQRLRLDLGLDGGLRVAEFERLEDRHRTAVGPFGVTAFMVDPLVHDASAIMVEADGASALYVGNLRAGILDKLLLTPPPHVDVLLMEGATVGAAASAEGFPSETDFENKFAALFRQTSGMCMVWCSAQNVDRVVTIYRACLRTNRQFVVDVATASMLRSVAPVPVPREVQEGIRVLVRGPERRSKRDTASASLPDTTPRIRLDELADAAPRSVVLFRPALMQDLENAKCLANARLIFSMWSGYLEYEKSNPVLEWLDRHGVPLDQCHTSGHAGIVELMELRRAFSTAPVVPIGRHAERFIVLFGRVDKREPGEWWEVSCVARPS